MSVNIIALETFKKAAKALSKKYHSFSNDYERLLNELEQSPQTGTDLGCGLRKVRMSIASKGKGKSGGARVITLVIYKCETTVNLLYIYDKSERSNITKQEIESLMRQNGICAG